MATVDENVNVDDLYYFKHNYIFSDLLFLHVDHPDAMYVNPVKYMLEANNSY